MLSTDSKRSLVNISITPSLSQLSELNRAACSSLLKLKLEISLGGSIFSRADFVILDDFSAVDLIFPWSEY
ncbi:hypothetical protein D3C73_1579510 [compost metagenome]